MLDVNDFKLVSLEALVHDEELFRSYLEFIEAIGGIYDIEHAFMLGEIDLGDDYVWEDQVMDKEVKFWKGNQFTKTAENFLKWTRSEWGYWPEHETEDVYALNASVLVENGSSLVLGRANLYSGLDRDRWTGMGFDCIHPDYRGEGLGRVIFAHRLNQAREKGVEEMYIKIKNDNQASRRRFQKFERRGCAYNYKFLRDKTLAWIKPEFTLEEAYNILITPLVPESPAIELA